MINWKINKLTVDEDNFVTQVNWQVTAVDGDLTATAVGTRTLPWAMV